MNESGRGAFLDRDGVLSLTVTRGGQQVAPRLDTDFHIHQDAKAQVARLRNAGFGIFVVTNQPDIARGTLVLDELKKMHRRLTAEVQPDEIAVCPHDDADECPCRKPKAGMLLDLARRHGVDLGRSAMIGDSWRDVGAGRAAGCLTVLLRTANTDARTAKADSDAVVGDLTAAVDWILGTMNSGEKAT